MGFLPGIESTDGSLPAYERVFAVRPEVYAARRALVAAIREGLDDRTYEVATVGAARRCTAPTAASPTASSWPARRLRTGRPTTTTHPFGPRR